MVWQHLLISELLNLTCVARLVEGENVEWILFSACVSEVVTVQKDAFILFKKRQEIKP